MGFSEKLCRWIKKKNGRTKKSQRDKEAPTDEVNNFTDHIYEEIPDVIPVGWRGVRSDSMPSFFLVAAAGVGEDSHRTCLTDSVTVDDDLKLDRKDMACRKVSLSSSCSYETPQNCLPSSAETYEDVRQNTLSEFPTLYLTTDNLRRSTYQSQSTSNSSPKCTRSRLSCVRAKCDHSDLVKDYDIGKDSNIPPHAFDQVGANEYDPDPPRPEPYYNILEPSWKKICDDIFSELLSPCLKADTKPLSASMCTLNTIGNNSVYSMYTSRNKLLGGLMIRNHDRQMSAQL